MNNSNLYKFATSFSGMLPDSDTPQMVYDDLVKLMREKKEYFMKLGPEKIFKLIFLIYSFKKFKNFEEGEKMINNLTFLKLLENKEEAYEPECDTCDGSGANDCDYCDGVGSQNCDDCDGDGTLTCPNCDGKGEVAGETGDMEQCDECGGDGQVDCDTCDGEGKIDCSHCDGGRIECYDCSGSGYLDTHEQNGQFSCAVTWNRFYSEKAEISEKRMEPLFDEIAIKISDYFLITQNEPVHAEFVEDMEAGLYFCTSQTDLPALKLNFNMEILWGPDFYKIENDYTK